ncbi:MAG: FAD-dependent oxidoreductase [Sphingobium limneticum]
MTRAARGEASADPWATRASLWMQGDTDRAQFPLLRGEVKAETAIIGGGITGLSAAWHLAGAGRSVVLLEAGQLASGSSGRNAAGWLPNYLDRTPDDIVSILGVERGDALNRMMVDSAPLLMRMTEKFGLAADVRRTGIAIASGVGRGAAAFATLQQSWMRYGARIEALGAASMAELSGTERFRCGLLFRDAGTIQPAALVNELGLAAARLGAVIHSGSPALAISAQGAGWRVRTGAGAVTAENILIATDGTAGAGLWPGLEKTYCCLPFAVIASAPAPGMVERLLPAGIPIADSNKANPFWTMASADRRIVASMLPPRREATTPAAVARPYERKLRRLYGDLPPLEWTHFWLGNVAISAERFPRALRLAQGVHAVGGYSGQGIAPGLAAGREYAAYVVAERREAASRLPFLDPRPVALRRLMPWLVRHVAAPLARVTDRSYLH